MPSHAGTVGQGRSEEDFFTPELLVVLERASETLAVSEKVPEAIEKTVLRIAKELADSSERRFADVDPYLRLAFGRGLTVSLLSLQLGSERQKRRLLRVGIEQMRQAVRDTIDGRFVRSEIPLKERVAWLADVLHLTQAELADLLGTNQRQLQRWLSAADPSEPRGDDAWRVELVSHVVDHLRHVLTPRGVVYWFESSHPELKGDSPRKLLDRPSDRGAQLIRLASGARSHAAS